jgi:hypothetical protein
MTTLRAHYPMPVAAVAGTALNRLKRVGWFSCDYPGLTARQAFRHRRAALAPGRGTCESYTLAPKLTRKW